MTNTDATAITTLQGAYVAVLALRLLTAPDRAPIPDTGPLGGPPRPNWRLILREQLAAVPPQHREAGEALVAAIAALERLETTS
ncbi:MAG: hypothetical protein AAGI34_13740 [Pseudomonadota bacterium]